MSKLEIDKHGKRWRNKRGQLHRKNGPAAIWYDGDITWNKNDQFHRIDGPAYCWNDGDKSWHLDDIFIREFQYDK